MAVLTKTVAARRGSGASACDKIMAVLRAADKPMSAYAILDQLRRQGLRSPPTVYRALERLIRAGRVHKIESLNAFVVCVHDGAQEEAARRKSVLPHSIFAICTGCGQVVEVDDPALCRAIARAGSQFLARADHCALEIAGHCALCAAADSATMTTSN